MSPLDASLIRARFWLKLSLGVALFQFITLRRLGFLRKFWIAQRLLFRDRAISLRLLSSLYKTVIVPFSKSVEPGLIAIS